MHERRSYKPPIYVSYLSLFTILAAKKAVVVPIHAVIISLIFLSSSKQEDRISRNIPAVTIVAACIKAEIGVGPSIASGSQMCSPISEDFPIAAIRRRRQMLFIITIYHKKIWIEQNLYYLNAHINDTHCHTNNNKLIEIAL